MTSTTQFVEHLRRSGRSFSTTAWVEARDRARRVPESRRGLSEIRSAVEQEPERHPVGSAHYLVSHSGDRWGIYSSFGLHSVVNGKDKAETLCRQLAEEGTISR
jgi:hypothetical protein